MPRAGGGVSARALGLANAGRPALRRGLNRAGAFTLIELLVVIAVVGMLVAIALPSLAGARRAALACKCVCQMRTLAQMTAIYADANRDAMPRSQHSAFAARALPWGYAFFEGVTGRAYEPGDAEWSRVFNGAYRCPLDRGRERWSYGYNVYFELTPDETGGPTWTRLSSAPAPSATVLFGELLPSSGADHAMAHFWTRFQAPPEIDARRHGDASGVAMLDGSARSAPFSDLFDPTSGVDRFDPATAR